MKKYLNKNKFELAVITLFILFTGGSYFIGFDTGVKLFETTFWDFLKEMLFILPAMFVIIGLFDVWIPREKIEQHVGKGSGLKGMGIMMLLALIQAGPLYAAFPVAYTLWKKGCTLFNIFIYIGTFSAVKIPMIIFEIGFLGVTFSVLRLILTIPVFILIAIIMGRYLRNKKYAIRSPDDS